MEGMSALYKWTETVLGARTFRIARYLFSGGVAAASNIALLFLLVHFSNMHYLYASIIAFTASIAVSFTMQKFWTFQDKSVHDVHSQFARYLLLIGTSLLLNTALMYLFVEQANIWYLSSQVLATAIIAVVNYFAYRNFVFRDRV